MGSVRVNHWNCWYIVIVVESNLCADQVDASENNLLNRGCWMILAGKPVVEPVVGST